MLPGNGGTLSAKVMRGLPTPKPAMVAVAGRRVRLLEIGAGAPVLMLHGSPNCAETLLPLAETLGRDFLALLPDTPGNGASTPLGSAEPAAYADAFALLLDALGLRRVGVYGFHSGAVFAAELARRHPERVSALVLEAYPLWTAAEANAFDDGFLQSYEPRADGSHLAALWSRVIDQTWYFPWHRREAATRIDAGQDDVARLHARAMELLAAGPAYREPYAAALGTGGLARLRAVRAPTLLLAGVADVLASHLARLPDGDWRSALCADRDEAARRALDWFRRHPPPVAAVQIPASTARFVEVDGGALYVEADAHARALWLHDAGGSGRLAPAGGEQVRIDLPGHGLSTVPWPATTARLRDILVEALDPLGVAPGHWAFSGAGLGRQIAELLAGGVTELRSTPMVVPDIAPRWDGGHLHAAWHFSRLRTQYRPWFERGRGRRLDRPLPTPAALQQMTLDVLRAGSETLALTLRYSVA